MSPSSRLVLAAAVVALVAVLIVGGLHTQPAAQPSPSTESTAPGSSDLQGASSSPTELPSGVTGTATESASDSLSTPVATGTPTTANPTQQATPKPVACTPTDQDQYIYHPYRLAVQAACIHVTGVVQAVRKEADGDLHILLALDPRYASLLTPANEGVELGDLVVEPVCVKGVTQADAIAVCAGDPDPLPPPYPTVGERVWMEGRCVFDLDHSGWAELHPLYRWGLL